jgi:hypothetical protein
VFIAKADINRTLHTAKDIFAANRGESGAPVWTLVGEVAREKPATFDLSGCPQKTKAQVEDSLQASTVLFDGIDFKEWKPWLDSYPLQTLAWVVANQKPVHHLYIACRDPHNVTLSQFIAYQWAQLQGIPVGVLLFE